MTLKTHTSEKTSDYRPNVRQDQQACIKLVKAEHET